jgi:hypothetical protein
MRERKLILRVKGMKPMSVAAQRCKILAYMFGRVLKNLDEVQNSSTADACAFDRSKIDIAGDAIHAVIAELEAQANWEGASD